MKIVSLNFKKPALLILSGLIIISPFFILLQPALSGDEAPIDGAAVKAAEETSAEISIIKKETGVSGAGDYEINLLPAAGVVDKTNEVWLRLKSRFKTSEIELERKKYGRAAPAAQSLEVSVSASGVTGEISAGSAEINLNPAAAAAAAEVLSAGAKTGEVKIESGENLFYRHCYSCHFDHSRLKTARVLAGKDFWLKYNPGGDNPDGILTVIRAGRRTVSGDMPFYSQQRLSDKEAAAVVEHLKSMVQPLNIEDNKAE
jgi:mono/diheme cytochrome c family protein